MILIVKSNFIVPPMSRQEIRRDAFLIRKALGIENNLYIDVLKLLEIVLPGIYPEFDYEIRPDSEMEGFLGRMDVEEKKIILPESVYFGAGDPTYPNHGWHRFTVTHEIGHFFEHSKVKPVLARGSDYKCYCDPEWQANAFAGEFLVPYHLTKDMSPIEIQKKCMVSKSAAQVQWNAMHKKRAL